MARDSVQVARPASQWLAAGIRRWIVPVLTIGVVGLLLRCSVADMGRVAGESMQPTLLAGDHILTHKLAYGLRVPGTHAWVLTWAEPQRGDVVVCSSPLDGRRIVKRIRAVPGDRVGDEVVPTGHYHVRGDNANSVDSRQFGWMPRERILGRAIAVVCSFDPRAACQPRWQRRLYSIPSEPARP